LEPLQEIYRFIPARVMHFRVFSLNHEYDEDLSMAAEKVLNSIEISMPTNVNMMENPETTDLTLLSALQGKKLSVGTASALWTP